MGWLIDNIDNSNRIAFEQGTLGGEENLRRDAQITGFPPMHQCEHASFLPLPPPLSQSPNLFSFSFIAVALALQGRVVRYRGGPCGRTGAIQPQSLLGNLVRCLSSMLMGLESRSVGFLSLGLGQFRAVGVKYLSLI